MRHVVKCVALAPVRCFTVLRPYVKHVLVSEASNSPAAGLCGAALETVVAAPANRSKFMTTAGFTVAEAQVLMPLIG